MSARTCAKSRNQPPAARTRRTGRCASAFLGNQRQYGQGEKSAGTAHTGQLVAAVTSPEVMPPLAPAIAMVTSTTPWTLGERGQRQGL
ncbi:hypothetical protein BAY59_10085 [Prauserella coralliicola]|nr:hypothetical protein BAY59_10085 [Prauserella coralliicola]